MGPADADVALAAGFADAIGAVGPVDLFAALWALGLGAVAIVAQPANSTTTLKNIVVVV